MHSSANFLGLFPPRYYSRLAVVGSFMGLVSAIPSCRVHFLPEALHFYVVSLLSSNWCSGKSSFVLPHDLLPPAPAATPKSSVYVPTNRKLGPRPSIPWLTASTVRHPRRSSFALVPNTSEFMAVGEMSLAASMTLSYATSRCLHKMHIPPTQCRTHFQTLHTR